MKYTTSKRLKIQKIQINQSYIEKLFDDCNKLYFNNKLPKLPINLITSSKVNGDFTFDVDFNINKITNMSIQINALNERSNNRLTATMVHEMLHYKVALELSEDEIKKAVWYYNDGQIDLFNKIMYADKYAHTGKWLDYVNEINSVYKLNINLK